jgi:hypothetical protein
MITGSRCFHIIMRVLCVNDKIRYIYPHNMNKSHLKILSLFILVVFSGGGSAIAQNDWWTEKPTGLYNNTTFGIVSLRGNLFTGMQTIFGYKLNPRFSVGGGIGLERYTDMPTYDTLTVNLSMMPIFAEVRYTAMKTRVSPVVALGGGYKVLLNVPSSQRSVWTETPFPGFLWTNYSAYDTYTEGGFFFSAELGMKANLWKRMYLYLSVNYSYWSVAGDYHLWAEEHTGENVTETHETTRTVAYTDQVMVRLGFGF